MTSTRTRKALAAATAFALALVAAIASGCGSSSNSTSTTTGPIVKAAFVTAQAGGAQVALSGTVSTGALPPPLTLNGTGAFNLGGHEGTFAVVVAGLPAATQSVLHGSTLQLREILKGGAIYVSSPLFASRLPGGAHWLRINLSQVEQALGLDPSSLTGGTDPTQYLQDLRGAASSVRVVGHETVRGVLTTRYAATIDVEKAAEQAAGASRTQVHALVHKLLEKTGQSTLPVEVWVDGQGRVRKITLALATKAGGQSGTAHLTLEYFNFGAPPTITAPPPSEVFDITAQTLEGLTSGG
jgi:hypothetical protein